MMADNGLVSSPQNHLTRLISKRYVTVPAIRPRPLSRFEFSIPTEAAHEETIPPRNHNGGNDSIRMDTHPPQPQIEEHTVLRRAVRPTHPMESPLSTTQPVTTSIDQVLGPEPVIRNEHSQWVDPEPRRQQVKDVPSRLVHENQVVEPDHDTVKPYVKSVDAVAPLPQPALLPVSPQALRPPILRIAPVNNVVNERIITNIVKSEQILSTDAPATAMMEPVNISPQNTKSDQTTQSPETIENRIVTQVDEQRKVSPKLEIASPSTVLRPQVKVADVEPQGENVRSRLPVNTPPTPVPEYSNDSAELSQSSTIHVTIGRIEVRATPQPSAPVPKQNTSPVMSLDEYLRRREQGGRA